MSEPLQTESLSALEKLKLECDEKDKRYSEREAAISSLIEDFRTRIDLLTEENKQLKAYEQRVETLMEEKIETRAKHEAEIEQLKLSVVHTPQINTTTITNNDDLLSYRTTLITLHDDLMKLTHKKDHTNTPFLFGSLPSDEKDSVTLDELVKKTQAAVASINDHMIHYESAYEIIHAGITDAISTLECKYSSQ